MYIPDLTPAEYSNDHLDVGWLEKGYDFTVGGVPDGFLDKIFEYSLRPAIASRGSHPCDFCEVQTFSMTVMHGKIKKNLGSNVIQVVGKNGIVYMAPDLIYHYVEAHNYRPPQEFIDAVMESDPPRDKSRWERLVQKVQRKKGTAKLW